MTQRRLDPAVILERLREIQLLLADLVEVGKVDAERLRRERPTRHVVERVRPSAGMRNVLVHDYLEVDHGKVSAAIPLALEQYGEYVKQVARWLRDHAAEPS